MVQLEKKESNETTWGMFCHLAAFSGLIGIPFGTILGPLVVWLLKKEESPFVDRQGRESLNFQISLIIYGVGALFLFLIAFGIILATVVANEEMAILIPITFPVMILVFFLIWIASFVLTIIAAVRAKSGEDYRYPLTFRFF